MKLEGLKRRNRRFADNSRQEGEGAWPDKCASPHPETRLGREASLDDRTGHGGTIVRERIGVNPGHGPLPRPTARMTERT